MNDWISAEKGLPVPDTLCLVAVTPRTKGKPTILVARYCKGFGRDDLGSWMSCPGAWPQKVTHWMELPDSPWEQTIGKGRKGD